MNRSIKDKLKFSQALAPVAVTADGTSASVDLQYANAATFLVSVATMAFDGSNKIDLSLEHSDDNSSWSACGEDDMYDPESASIYKSLDSASDDESVHALHYRGNKRYARVKLDVTGTVSVITDILAVQGHNELNPAL